MTKIKKMRVSEICGFGKIPIASCIYGNARKMFFNGYGKLKDENKVNLEEIENLYFKSNQMILDFDNKRIVGNTLDDFLSALIEGKKTGQKLEIPQDITQENLNMCQNAYKMLSGWLKDNNIEWLHLNTQYVVENDLIIGHLDIAIPEHKILIECKTYFKKDIEDLEIQKANCEFYYKQQLTGYHLLTGWKTYFLNPFIGIWEYKPSENDIKKFNIQVERYKEFLQLEELENVILRETVKNLKKKEK